jgi:hypothetical protein
MKLLNVTHPSTTQKQVIATIASAATPQLADEYTNATQNIVAAKRMLLKLGLLQQGQAGLELTDTGWQVATEEGIVSEPHGELTNLGQQLAGQVDTGGGNPSDDDTGADEWDQQEETPPPSDTDIDTASTTPNEIGPTNASGTTAIS